MVIRLHRVRLSQRELARDPALARDVSRLVDSLRRRAGAPAAADAERWVLEIEPRPAAPAPAQRDLAVERALGLMQANLTRRWTVRSLAKAAGLSRAAFARRFARSLGESPIARLARLRLEHAAHLLVHSDASLAEVAGRVGYSSEFAFSRAFKRHHALSPASFRRLQRGFAAPSCCALAA
jgi:transcriptional regulator GlxA family with amidase domain